MTKLIVGLGNPGKTYEKTRHNVGFFIVDALAKQESVSLNRQKFKGHYGEISTLGPKVILLEPQTYMNLSGECVQAWMNFLKINGENLLVIHDELDLPLGRLKAQFQAGAGGHNGVRSIIECLGHKDFNRLRIGVGHPGRVTQVLSHVLTPFQAEEKVLLEEVVAQAAQAVKLFVEKGLDPVAQLFNRKS